jgi:hypothetical protein
LCSRQDEVQRYFPMTALVEKGIQKMGLREDLVKFMPRGSLESMTVKVTNLAGTTRVQIWRPDINLNRLRHNRFTSYSSSEHIL